jgi:hypothetical protein
LYLFPFIAAPKKPSIQAQTSPVLLGSSTTIHCLTTSTTTGTFTYAWYKAGSVVAGETSRDLTFASLASGDLASYTCTVTDSVTTGTSLTSASFTLAVDSE